MKLAQEQPDNVCFECGEKWGVHKLKSNESHRVWIDQCDVCLKLKAVADASEYGYLKEGWDGEEVLQ
jgi:hypothetical protein